MSTNPATSLPSMENTFNISVVGDDTGQKFEGDFTYKRLNIKDRSNVIMTYNRLKVSSENMSQEMDSLLYMIAYLKYGIKSAPKWWTDSDGGLNLYDLTPIAEVFARTQKFEMDWRKQVFGDEEKTEEKKEDDPKE